MSAWLAWLTAGLGLLGAEILVPGVFLMWLGLAAIGTALVSAVAAPGLVGETIGFAGLAIAAVLVARLVGRVPGSLNRPGSGLVGRDAVALGPVGGSGRVRVGDSDWPARSADGTIWPFATTLRVVGVEGVVLVVDRR